MNSKNGLQKIIFFFVHHFEAKYVERGCKQEQSDIDFARHTVGCVARFSTLQQRRTIVRNDEPSTSLGVSHIPTFQKVFQARISFKKYFKREYPYLRDWTVTDNVIIAEMRKPGFLIPKYHLQIDESLELTIAVYGATVPISSALFPENKSHLFSKFKNFHNGLCALHIYCGVSVVDNEPRASGTFLRVTPLVATKQQSSLVNFSQTKRSMKCKVLVEQGTEKCKASSKLKEENSQPKPALPAKAKACLTACSSANLQAIVREEQVQLKESQLKCMQPENTLKRVENEIVFHGATLDDNASNSFLAILYQTNLQTTPHMKLVFEQQQKVKVASTLY